MTNEVKECPECGDELRYSDSGKFYYCADKQCPYTEDKPAEEPHV